jgi:hypothetical protein
MQVSGSRRQGRYRRGRSFPVLCGRRRGSPGDRPAVCLAFADALHHFGVPDEVLTHNGKQFTGRFNQPARPR